MEQVALVAGHLDRKQIVIFSDWNRNPHSFRARVFLLSYRLTSSLYRHGRFATAVSIPFFVAHKVLETILGCELSWKVECGPRLRLFHLVGLIVNPATKIGSDCTLRHCTTLGARRASDDAPRIGDGVDIGCNAVVLGGLCVGDNAKIGAGAVVVADVPANATVIGSASRILSQ